MNSPSPATVDIITPTNRSGEFLEHTVTSVIEQTNANWQLFIVDNGSPDPTALARSVEASVAAGGDPSTTRDRIHLVQTDQRGVSAARNHGIGLGHADYVAFLDDDDLWDPRFLERMVRALEENPAAVAAYCAGRFVDDAGERFGYWSARRASSAQMLRGDVPFPRIMAFVVRRSVGEQTGWFDPRYAYVEDMDLVCRVLIAGELTAVDEQLAFYRIHSASVSRTGDSIRLGWMGFERFLGDRIREARAAGNRALCRQLVRNRRLARRTAAGMASHSVMIALASRNNLPEARRTARWALTHAPLAFVGSALARIASRAFRVITRRVPGTD